MYLYPQVYNELLRAEIDHFNFLSLFSDGEKLGKSLLIKEM